MIGGARQPRWTPRSKLASFYLECLVRVVKPSDRILFASLPEYAAARCPDQKDPRAVARQRMEAIYNVRDVIPPQLTHALAWWIDTHVPLVASDASGFHIMYRQGLAPEDNYDFAPVPKNYLARYVWYNSMPVHLTADEVAFVKFLRKSGSAYPSIRYITTSILRCSKLMGKQRDDPSRAIHEFVGDIVRLHELSLYFDRTRLRSPSERIRIYTMSTPELVRHYCEPKQSTLLYAIVSTYLAWCVKADMPLHGIVKDQQPAFLRQVAGYGLEYDGNPAISRTYSPPYPPHSSYKCFYSAIDVRKKLPVWVQECGITIDDVDRCSKYGCRPTGVLLSVGGLRAAGVSEEGALTLVATVSTKHDAAAVLSKISARDRALLYIVLLSESSRKALQCGRASADVVRVQQRVCNEKYGTSAFWVTVCVACGTWRPKSKCMPAVSKATSGVIVDFVSDSLRCNACFADWSVAVVNLVGIRLKAKLRLSGPPELVMLCTSCGVPASPCRFVGTLPLCDQCHDAERKLLSRPMNCIVCRADAKSGNGGVFDCWSTFYGTMVPVAACHRHGKYMLSLGQDRHLESILIDSEQTSKDASMYKGAAKMRLSKPLRKNYGASVNRGRKRWDDAMV
jgi:hypothetical protein